MVGLLRAAVSTAALSVGVLGAGSVHAQSGVDEAASPSAASESEPSKAAPGPSPGAAPGVQPGSDADAPEADVAGAPNTGEVSDAGKPPAPAVDQGNASREVGAQGEGEAAPAGQELPPPVQASCPPGWYCEPLPPSERQTPAGPVRQEPVPGGALPAPPAQTEQPGVNQQAEPIEPSAPPPLQFHADSPPAEPASPALSFLWPRWGIGARGSLALMNSLAPHRALIGGFGVVGKARPFRSVQFELAVDGFVGRDYHYDPRRELAFSFGVSLTPSMRRQVRPMLLASSGYSLAHVGTGREARNLNHFNTAFGAGIEVDFVEGWSAGLDLIALLRWRVDSERRPEFRDPYRAAATDASGGGLLRLAISHYF